PSNHRLWDACETATDLNLSNYLEFLVREIDGILALFKETSTSVNAIPHKSKAAILSHAEVVWWESKLYRNLPLMTSLAMEVRRNLDTLEKSQVSSWDGISDKLSDGWAITRLSTSRMYDSCDAVTAVGTLLGFYLTRFGTVNLDTGYRYHVDRDGKGTVTFEDNLLYWNYLIDRGGAQSFALGKVARANRLAFQIAMLESFWDISSHFKARRVFDLLDQLSR
ncbi:MAG: hypothetical protein KDN22_34385, partial [Verrucomicrobiae bacterium]|nr:hypothetical protein [Verrucomicrobiae bacterium]